jgi:hypothetical protein
MLRSTYSQVDHREQYHSVVVTSCLDGALGFSELIKVRQALVWVSKARGHPVHPTALMQPQCHVHGQGSCTADYETGQSAPPDTTLTH